MKFKENEMLELKKSTSELKEAIISICAILNKHQKGKIVFGIKSNGDVIGQDINEKTLRDISQQISAKIEPKIFPKIYEIKIKGKKCISIEFEGNNLPYYAYGRAYVRVADEDKLISSKELEKIILEKNKDKLRWDNDICSEANFSDINIERLKWFLKEAGKNYNGVEESLKKLNLLKGKKLFNTSIILFGKTPKDFFRNAKLRCAVFGTKDTTFSIDMKEFEGNLFDLIEKAEEYFLQHINIGMKIEGLKRINIPEINKEAFREAIINAFCHRDYWNDDNVHLAIFKDRVEVRSPGLLYGNLTIKKIRKEKVSERRNELIAEMFHMVHFVERWGSGIGKILKLEPETEFRELGRKFYSIFKRKDVQEEDGTSEKTAKNQPKTSQKPAKEERKKLILQAIKGKIFTKRGFAKEIEMNKSTIEEDLKELKDEGKIKFIGSKKGGYWEIL